MTTDRHPTVLHALLDRVEAEPEGPALEIVSGPGQCEVVSWAGLYELARRGAAGLEAAGLGAGDRLILALPTCREFFALYLGALFRRVVPLVVPAAQPGRRHGEAGERFAPLCRMLGCRHVAVPAEALEDLAGGLPARALDAAALLEHGRAELLPLAVGPGDIAHLQSTSGSTGEQKLAVVRHGNIAANVAGIGAAIAVGPGDKLSIWLPLYHDMGLIAFACTLYWQRPMVLTDPSNFVRHPIRYWLDLIGRHRVTITAAPNSAYQVCARLARRRTFAGLDLSSCRAAFWGAEPIHAETVRGFERAFAPYGYRPEATLPVYGLAEATLGCTVAEVREPARIRRFAGRTLAEAAPALGGGDGRVEAVSVGRPLVDHRLRIVGPGRRPLEEGRVGEIEFGGPSVVDGYWRDGGEPARCAHGDGFLPTGDLGLLLDGELYVVGRSKEIIIVGGRNFVPVEVELAAARALDPDLHKGVAAFGMPDPIAQTDAVHLLIEAKKLPVDDRPAVEEAVRDELARALGLRGVAVHWTAKGGIPRTTSGKVQRFRCRELVAAAPAAGDRPAAAVGREP